MQKLRLYVYLFGIILQSFSTAGFYKDITSDIPSSDIVTTPLPSSSSLKPMFKVQIDIPISEGMGSGEVHVKIENLYAFDEATIRLNDVQVSYCHRILFRPILYNTWGLSALSEL